MPRPQPFGTLLRTLRIQRKLTLSRVARALDLSVVYYRDVELGRRRPFSALKVDFDVLAGLLNVEVAVLLRSAVAERGQLEFDFRDAAPAECDVALLLVRCLRKKSLARADLRRLKDLLVARAG